MKKIPTIFKRNPKEMNLVLDEPNPVCNWVFAGEGVATRKYDGTCCKIDESGYWKRREVKKGNPVPANFVMEEEDSNTGKKFGWVPVSPDAPGDRWFREAYHKNSMQYGTYELLGPKVQGNPEKFAAHILYKHSEAEVFPDVPRNFAALHDFLFIHDVEGLVFHHPDGRMAKIKKRDFGMKR